MDGSEGGAQKNHEMIMNDKKSEGAQRWLSRCGQQLNSI